MADRHRWRYLGGSVAAVCLGVGVGIAGSSVFDDDAVTTPSDPRPVAVASVPDFRGATWAEVGKRLGKIRVGIAVRPEEFDRRRATVISQSPPPGSALHHPDFISLTFGTPDE